MSFCAPGQNLDGWSRPDTPHCDYCGKFRRSFQGISDRILSLSFNLCRGVGQLVLVLFGVSQQHEATTA